MNTNAANDPIPYLLTPREIDMARIAAVRIEEHRRALNARDKAAQEAAQRGNDARLGVVWLGDVA